MARVYSRHRRCLWCLGMEFTTDSATGIEDGIALTSNVDFRWLEGMKRWR
jgi:hypothetical protein